MTISWMGRANAYGTVRMLHEGMLTDVLVMKDQDGRWYANNVGLDKENRVDDIEDAKAVAAAVYLLSERKHNEL